MFKNFEAHFTFKIQIPIDPAQNGRVKNHAHFTIHVVSTKAGVAAVAGVQRIGKAGQNKQQRQ